MTVKTRYVWLNCDPESGIWIEPPWPKESRALMDRHFKKYPSLYRRVAIPVESLTRYKAVSKAYCSAQRELMRLFDGAQVSE